MTSWGELLCAVVGWFALVTTVFWLGRMWERDHPKTRIVRQVYDLGEGRTAYIEWAEPTSGVKPGYEDPAETARVEAEVRDTFLRVRRAPYDWTNEG